MKVIFIKDLKRQGKKDEIKEVSDGYAINFLIKNGYAVKYTKVSNDRLENDISNMKSKEENDIFLANKVKDRLLNENISFSVSCGESGKVFGSVSSKQVFEKLKELGYDISKKQIIMNNLVSLGYHVIKIVLHKKVMVEIKVLLVAR